MICSLCPRKCLVDRSEKTGVCGVGDKITIAKVMHHFWEEPSISGTKGSGAIFFSGCPLRCVYCQNHEISHEAYGHEISEKDLSEIMLKLQKEGVHNINLVSPTQFSDKIRKSIDIVKDELKIPVVYNTGGYELASEIEKMAGYVDVFLTDIKYFSPEISMKYSKATDYYENAVAAFGKMLEIAPEPIFDENGIMKKGVILRHLVLPGQRHDSMKILSDIKGRYGTENIKLSLMSQYTPSFCSDKYPELKRKITSFEYESVLDYAINLGYDGYMQKRNSATEIYTPKFK